MVDMNRWQATRITCRKSCVFFEGALQGPKRVLRCPKVLHVSMVIFWCPGRQACQTETHATCPPVAIVQRTDKISFDLRYESLLRSRPSQSKLLFPTILQPTDILKADGKATKTKHTVFLSFFQWKTMDTKCMWIYRSVCKCDACHIILYVTLRNPFVTWSCSCSLFIWCNFGLAGIHQNWTSSGSTYHIPD